MNEVIVHNWNKTIRPKDVTYILGDVSFGSLKDTVTVLDRLNGKKILIVGNHDEQLIRQSKKADGRAFLDCFDEHHNYLEIHAAGVRVCMFHFPVYEWSNMHKGSIHYHGHLHCVEHGIPGRIKDVGMDGNQCVPYDLDELSKTMLELPVRTHHGRKGEGL